MKLALIAHDGKKSDMVAFVMKRLEFFNRADVEIVTTGTTGKKMLHAGVDKVEAVASGPLGGHLTRPSDKNEPTKLAFINCVGSRDIKNNPYCSSCCCMYTTKEAMIAYEHNNEIETSIFYIDLRAAGKGFREYIQRGEDKYSITYIKGKVAKILEDDQRNRLIIYEDINTSHVKQLKFDLVILATTMVPKKDAVELANILGIKLNDFNFFKGDSYQPQISSREGIFLCGACREPMDIPTSVIDASGAAAKAAEIVMRG